MTTALEEAIERLRKMSVERQDAFARMLLREILADDAHRFAAHSHHPRDMAKVIGRESNVGCLDCHIGATRPYCYAYIGSSQRRKNS